MTKKWRQKFKYLGNEILVGFSLKQINIFLKGENPTLSNTLFLKKRTSKIGPLGLLFIKFLWFLWFLIFMSFLCS